MDESTSYQKAKERVEEIKGFYMHLLMYIIINSISAVVNLIYVPEHIWFYWGLLGWGIGLAAHGFSVFGIGGLFGAEWEERKIKQIMDKERQRETGGS